MSQAPDIHSAAFRGEIDIVREILSVKPELADASSPNWENGTPLTLASYAGHVEIVRLLLDSGANVDSQCDDGSALLMAAFSGHAEIAALLLERGADPNLASVSGETPLMAAALKGSLEIVRLLIARGAIPDAQTTSGTTSFVSSSPPVRGESALHLAAERGHVEVVRLLLEHGANRCLKDHAGRSPRMWAAGQNQQAINNLLK